MIIKMETKHEMKDCGQCDYKYETLEDLMNHVKNTPDHKPKCCECNTTYISLTIFRQHVRKIHFNKGEVVCPECGKKSANKEQQSQHWYVVHKVAMELLFCNLCGKGWNNLSKLRKHTRKCLFRDPDHVEKERKISEKQNPKCAEQVVTWTMEQYNEWQKAILNKERKLTNNNNDNTIKKSQTGIKNQKLPTKDSKKVKNSKGKSFASKKHNLKEETDEENETSRSKKMKLLDGTINILWNGDDKEIDNMDEDHLNAAEEEALGYDLLWNDDDNANVVENSEGQEDSNTIEDKCLEKTHEIKEEVQVHRNPINNKVEDNLERKKMKIEDIEEISNHLNVITKVHDEAEKVLAEIGQIVQTTFLDENPTSEEVRKPKIIKSEMEMENNEEEIVEKKYKCPISGCNNSYTNGSNYRRHYRKNHKSIETSTSSLEIKHPKIEPTAVDLTCKECNTTLKTMKNLKRHIRDLHTDTGRIICPVCSKYVQRSHINQAHKEEASICDLCSALFKNRHSLMGHKRKVHGNIENIPCPHCGQVIETKYKLSQHIYAVHNLQESPCDQCGKTYKNIKLLQAHKKVMHPELK